jgi:hypothetical protein
MLSPFHPGPAQEGPKAIGFGVFIQSPARRVSVGFVKKHEHIRALPGA